MSQLSTLYLTYDGLTDPLGQSQILPYLLGLEGKGVVFHIISFEKKDKFQQHEESIRELISGKSIHWWPFVYHKSPPVFSTLMDLRILFDVSKVIVKREHIHTVHCRSYVTALVGLWLKRKLGVKFIFDMRGFWADERVEGNIWNLKNPAFKIIYTFFKRKEKQFFKEADAIVSLTENAKSFIEEHFILSPDHPIKVIPCCADLELFSRKVLQKEKLGQIEGNLKKDFQFKLLYLGSLGTWYLFDEMLLFFTRLLEEQPGSQFLILTNDTTLAHKKLSDERWKLSASSDLFGKQAMKYSKDDSTKAEIIVSQANRNDVPLFIEYSDASIMFIKPSFSKKASSATKMGEVLVMDKPVVTNIGWGDVDLLKSKTGNMVVVDVMQSENYRTTVRDLISITHQKVETSAFVRSYFSLEHGIGQYEEVYKDLHRRTS